MATLIKPGPPDPSKSSIESNLFTNTRPLWHPPGARGIYGGAVIAQCLSAAQRTVPENFTVHSMHCYFVLAGNADIPIIYHVERVREGKSFATRTVQARQRGKPIFTTTMSFVRENSGGKQLVEHASEMPDIAGPVDEEQDLRSPQGSDGPFQSQRIDILNHDSASPHEKKTRQWVKARGRISPSGGHQAHLSALAYMSDSYFIGTVARVHRLWRYAAPRNADGSKATAMIDDDVVKKLRSMDDDTLARMQGMDADVIDEVRKLKLDNNNNNDGDAKASTAAAAPRPEVGMMVSLDHTIYFHNPREFRADEWLFTEMESPWAGDGRGLVFQRIFTREGKLVASCVQEGVVRLKQPADSKL
ncbi:hypothetical protein B0A49_03657 [Cryomyces minteri]|uniref:Acyl-CoA thioesterase II n=1 Tax=Cryomyces minteri TaxID=331657 RepID=A0A4U0XCU7_9PEZI|nr:hypothetical protein B0A49_03657 [Cryomyces minteri]